MNRSSARAVLCSVVLFSVLIVLAVATPAVAQRRYPPGPPQVLPAVITNPVNPKPQVAGTRFHADPDDVLPVTGAVVTLFALGGAGAVAGGMLLVRLGRRRNR